MSQLPPSPPSPFPPQQPAGQPVVPGGAYTMAPQRQTSGAAVASLICGILGCVPLLTGLLAIILGIVGLRTNARATRYTGRGMAIAGLILGLISLIAWGVIAGGGVVGADGLCLHKTRARGGPAVRRRPGGGQRRRRPGAVHFEVKARSSSPPPS